ncbi:MULTISPECIES: hypothetical protein [Halorussus]|uniref:hypothetical protein n=1 Tax=Halorussus TaxID=1070314 RepID=UPI0013B41870|nr:MULTISPECIES: hypothetical protein [Halorussus]NHN60970.1 hypothetical protein [Halorussus sp. JP-T4]
MNTHATLTADDARGRVETYARTNSDGEAELVLYTPDATREWIRAARSSTVDVEEHR